MISIIFINIQIVVFIVMALYIWFDTDAFIEWGELFHLKFLKYKQYNDVKKSALSSMAAKSYSDFLLFHYGKYFLIRLITCPICFSVWVNFVALGVLYSVIGGIGMLGINVIFSWLGYYGLKKVLKRLDA